jgi:hypothetical protein
MSDRMIDKVGKLLTQAENAGTPEEAAAFMERAQELAGKNAIDLALARHRQLDKTKVQEPEERSIQVNPYTRKVNRKHFMELAMRVADVNDLEYLIGGREYKLLAVGFPADLEVFEALYTHLSVQMVMECDAALKAGANRRTQLVPKQTWEPIPESERQWGEWHDGSASYYNDEPGWPRDARSDPPSRRLVPVLDEAGQPIMEERSVAVTDGRAFRNDFYDAFVARMSARLWEAKRAALKDAGVGSSDSTETTLALRDKKEVVEKAHAEQRAKVKHLGVYTGVGERASDHTGAGRAAGRSAAERTPIGSAREVGR